MDDDRTNIRNVLQDFQTFPKPFTRDELLAEVRNVLNMNRPLAGMLFDAHRDRQWQCS
jgi:hypothetical protein